MLFAELHGAANVPRFFREHQDWQLSARDRHERVQLHVALKVAGTAMAQRLRVMASTLEPFRELGHLLLVFLLRVAVGFLLSGKGGEIKSLRLDGRPVQHHRDVLLQQHVADRPAGHVNRGCLPAQNSRRTAGIHAAARRNGKNLGDPRGTRHGNMFARRQHGFGGDHVGIERAGLRRINGGVDCADLAQAHLRNRIE